MNRITFVLFFPDGECGLVRSPADRLDLPTGELDPDEDVLDAVLRIPLMTAGFRTQRFHPIRWDGDHLYAWVVGDRYDGRRPHRKVALEVTSPEEAGRRLRAQGSRRHANLVSAATRSYRTQSEADYYAENAESLETCYLRAATVEGGSGFGGTPEEWREQREPVLAGIEQDGTFLDVGCANGLLMESAYEWCLERGVIVEPYGVDLAPRLVDVARLRLPWWADRLWVGNAIDWVHPTGMRFDHVHVLLDSVPASRYGAMLGHLLDHVVDRDGRLLVSHYRAPGSRDRSAVEIVTDLGFTLAGAAPPYTAWIDRRGR